MRNLLFAFLILSGWIVFAANPVQPKDWTADMFLSRVRNPPGRQSWALMKGFAQHSRNGMKPVKAPIEMGIFFTPVRTLAQIRFNKNEVYNIGQSYGKDGSTSVDSKTVSGGKPQIGIYGITPEDLAMSFLYWKFERELKNTSVRGQECRVFLLKNKEGSERVKVAVSCEYFFPLKAEWYRGNSVTAIRSLEAASFKKEKDYWFVSKIILSGKDWTTQIRFPEVDAGEFNGKLPAGVFKN